MRKLPRDFLKVVRREVHRSSSLSAFIITKCSAIRPDLFQRAIALKARYNKPSMGDGGMERFCGLLTEVAIAQNTYLLGRFIEECFPTCEIACIPGRDGIDHKVRLLRMT